MLKKTLFFSLVLLLSTGCEDKNIPTGKADPLYSAQWYLNNTGQSAGASNGGTIGEDIRLGNTWDTYRGSGIKVGIVDSGVELLHPDLSANIDLSLSAHYADNDNDPTPNSSQLAYDTVGAAHGTACAGIVAALAHNGAGGRGVAPEATLAGLNAFSNPEPVNFADALYSGVFDVYTVSSSAYPFSNSDQLDISSNSWSDAPGNMDDEWPELYAIREGIARGREGKGIVYCFAAGNFRYYNYNANWNREQNNPYVIAVAALNADGRYSSYSNFGANILISAFGGEFGDTDPAIVTTDLTGEEGKDAVSPFNDYNDYNVYISQSHFSVKGNENAAYTNRMNGTSSATPMVAGSVALILQANPTLTYRDVRYVLATTARKNDPDNSDWVQNGAGHWINHNYGFGAIDVAAAIASVTAAEYTLLENNISQSYTQTVNLTDINDTNPALIEITIPEGEKMTIEFAELTVKNLLGQIEDLQITLQSPAETNATLSNPNLILNTYESGLYADAFADFTFGSVRYLDENSSGTWRLYITDTRANTLGATLEGVTLTLHGRSPQ